jgi:prepilin-type processing-associated H-X9-DG protein
MAGWVESGTSAFDERLYYLSNAAKGTSLEALRPHFKKMPARQTQVKNTAALPLLCDVNKTATNGNVNLDAALTWPWVAYNLENAGRADNNKALNHLMRGGQVIGINSAYADGHVEWRKDDEILPRSRTNRQGVGNTVFWY